MTPCAAHSAPPQFFLLPILRAGVFFHFLRMMFVPFLFLLLPFWCYLEQNGSVPARILHVTRPFEAFSTRSAQLKAARQEKSFIKYVWLSGAPVQVEILLHGGTVGPWRYPKLAPLVRFSYDFSETYVIKLALSMNVACRCTHFHQRMCSWVPWRDFLRWKTCKVHAFIHLCSSYFCVCALCVYALSRLIALVNTQHLFGLVHYHAASRLYFFAYYHSVISYPAFFVFVCLGGAFLTLSL